MKPLILVTAAIVGLSSVFVISNDHPDSNLNISTASFLSLDVDSNDVFPALFVQEDGKSAALGISAIDIDVQITGNLAYVLYDLTYYNHLDRVLEGELYFPLNDGQTVSHFELEVNDRLREGVIVEKEKGRIAFESTVRKQIDPGLIEWTKGNNFKTRIYPIPARGTKRVVIGFQQELKFTEDGAVFYLPMNFKDQVGSFKFNASALNQNAKPIVPKSEFSDLIFEKWESSYRTQLSKENYIPNQDIGFLVPMVKSQSIGISAIGPKQNNIYYGVIKHPVSSGKLARDRVAVVFDASHSSTYRDIDKELNLIGEFIGEKSSPIDLYVLRNDFVKTRVHSLEEVKNFIKSCPLDGATQFGAIDLESEQYDMVLLLSDGMQSFGQSNAKFGNNPVSTINSSKMANHSYLRLIARNQGGNYINLINTTVADGIVELGSGLPLFTIKENGLENIALRQYVSGKHIYYTFCGRSDNELKSISYTIGNKSGSLPIEASVVDYLGKIWAQRVVSDWSNFAHLEADITQIGKDYHVVTPNTSLIVLDRVEDYVEHEIEPPAELLNEWVKLISEKKVNKKEADEAHFKKVIEDFEARKKWYEKDFDWKKVIKDKGLGADVDSLGNLIYRVQTGAFSNDITITDSLGAEGEMPMMFYNMDVAATETTDDVSDLEEAVDGNFLRGRDDNINRLPQETEKDKSGKTAKNKAKIDIAAWSPDTPYMKKLKNINDKSLYPEYLVLKKEYQSQPSFFLDVADLFIEKKKNELALRILSNVAELKIEDHQLMRALAHRLDQLGYHQLAYYIFEEVARIRSEEPQSFRDLGLVSYKLNKPQEAIDHLYSVIKTDWDDRFPGIEVIAACEMNYIIANSAQQLNLAGIDNRLIYNMPMDIRVVTDWDADNCDIDLWVTDPLNEKCFYSHKETAQGGLMSNDFTRGYGPEEFNIKNGAPGSYKIEVNYFGSSQQTISGPTTIMIKIYTNYGKPNQKLREVTRRMTSTKEVIDIGNVVLEN